MVNLTRIYTKTGDDGTTSLGDMSLEPQKMIHALRHMPPLMKLTLQSELY